MIHGPLLADTSGLLAALFADQRHHEACAKVLRELTNNRIILSPFVLAELDYLIHKYAGTAAEILFLEDVAAGAYYVPPVDSLLVEGCLEIIQKYRPLDIGLADASLVIYGQIYDTHDILTLDRRHFETLRVPPKRPFQIYPK